MNFFINKKLNNLIIDWFHLFFNDLSVKVDINIIHIISFIVNLS